MVYLEDDMGRLRHCIPRFTRHFNDRVLDLVETFFSMFEGDFGWKKGFFFIDKKEKYIKKEKSSARKEQRKDTLPPYKDINKKSRYRKTLPLNLHPPNQIFPMCFRSGEGGTVSSEHNLESVGPIPVIFFCNEKPVGEKFGS